MKFQSLLLAGVVFASAAHAQDVSKQFPVKGGAPSGASSKKPKGKPQSSLASKAAFASIKASDPLVKKAIAATNLAAAAKMAGKNGQFVGTVAKAYAPKSNSIVLLNFAKDYKTAIVGAVKAKDFAKFPNLTALAGKKVLMSGPVIVFKGAPEVELSSPIGIKIIK